VGWIVAAAGLCAAAPSAHAAWPDDKPIEIIVGYQAGSGPDILARRMAPAMAKHLGPRASFVVSNRAGAAGEIALTAVSRAEPSSSSSSSRGRNMIRPRSSRSPAWSTIRH
jgi:tripartite-type tricarboxylate transporter receptor subunit TctC